MRGHLHGYNEKMVNPYQPPEIDDRNDEHRKPIDWRGYRISGGAIVIGILLVSGIELLGIRRDDQIIVLIGLVVVVGLIGSSLVKKAKD